MTYAKVVAKAIIYAECAKTLQSGWVDDDEGSQALKTLIDALLAHIDIGQMEDRVFDATGRGGGLDYWVDFINFISMFGAQASSP